MGEEIVIIKKTEKQYFIWNFNFYKSKRVKSFWNQQEKLFKDDEFENTC